MNSTFAERLVILLVGLPLILAICAAFGLLLAWPFMWLWNYAMVEAISIAMPLTYWPAYCLLLLVSFFLVGSHSGSK